MAITGTFAERRRKAVALKHVDVEELIDVYFHRQLAAVIAAIVTYISYPITPNQITIAGLFVGLISGVFLYEGIWHTLHGSILGLGDVGIVYSAVLLFVWTVLDCADGQVARLCNRGTRTGRVLDGFVDAFILVVIYSVLGFGIGNLFGSPWCWLSAAGGFSMWGHTLVYDRVKNTYIANVAENSTEADETPASVWQEFLEARKLEGYTLNTVLLAIYSHWLIVQGSSKKELIHCTSDKDKAAFQNEFKFGMRLCSYLGIATHVVVLYLMLPLAYYWHFDALKYMQYIFIAWNILMVYSLILERKMLAFVTKTVKGK